MISITELKALTPIELEDKVKKFSAQVVGYKDDGEKLRKEAPEMGKTLFALQVHMETDKSENRIPRNMSFTDYHKRVTATRANPKGNAPFPHGLQCCVCFGALVDSARLDEADYDACVGSALSVASAIINEVNGDLTNPAVEKTIDILKKRSGNYTKTLKAILLEVKPASKWETADAEKALAEIRESGNLDIFLIVVARICCAEIAPYIPGVIEDLNSVSGRKVFEAMAKAAEKFETLVNKDGSRKFPDEMLAEWAQANEPHVPTLNGKAPEPEAPEEPAPAEDSNEGAMKAREQELVTA